MQYRVLIEPDEDGVFVAEVPALPGCISDGKMCEEAIANIKEAIAAYVESLKLARRTSPATRFRGSRGG